MKRKRKKTNFLDFELILLILLLILTFLLTEIKFIQVKVIDGGLKIKNLSFLYFLFFKKELAQKIFLTEPSVVKIKFKPSLLNFALMIELEKEEPIAIICSNQCFYLGNHSYIYPEKINFAYLIIRSSLEIKPYSYLSPLLTLALTKIFEYSNLTTLPLKEVHLLSNYDLKLITAENKSILLDPHKDIDKQLKKLSYFLANYKKSDYFQLDLRIPNKIYFK